MMKIELMETGDVKNIDYAMTCVITDTDNGDAYGVIPFETWEITPARDSEKLILRLFADEDEEVQIAMFAGVGDSIALSVPCECGGTCELCGRPCEPAEDAGEEDE